MDVEFPKLRDFGDAEYEVLLYEFKADLNKYLAGRGSKYKTLKDLIEFNEKNADKEMPYFGQEIFIQAEAKGDLNDRAYRIALLQSKLMTQEQGIDGVMDKNKLDAIVAPSGRRRVDDRPGKRRLRRVRKLVAGGGFGVSEYHGPGGFCAGAPGRDIVFRAGLFRGRFDKGRICF